MFFLDYTDIRKRVGVGLIHKERRSGIVLDRDGAILVYSCVSRGRIGM